MNKEMEYIGDYNGYQIFRNSEGYLEGYKSTGRKETILKDHNGRDIFRRSDHNRIVSQCKDMSCFIKFINGFKKPKPKSSLPAPEQPKLFDDTNI